MDERGFTLVELLTVILIIGLLAAIALPTFLGQRQKADDAAAKADIRNAVSQMEACRTDFDDYSACPGTDHPLATGVVATPSADGTAYRVTKVSHTGTTFTIQRLADGVSRTCTHPGFGGCSAIGSW